MSQVHIQVGKLPSSDFSLSKEDILPRRLKGEMTWIVNGEPEASLQAPSGISCKPLHRVMEIRAAFYPLLVTNILYQ